MRATFSEACRAAVSPNNATILFHHAEIPPAGKSVEADELGGSVQGTSTVGVSVGSAPRSSSDELRTDSLGTVGGSTMKTGSRASTSAQTRNLAVVSVGSAPLQSSVQVSKVVDDGRALLNTEGESEAPMPSDDTEAAKPKALPTPSQPTKQEIEEHNITHLPYRSWCKHCVRGRGKSHAHHQLDAESSHVVPHVSFDYVFLGQDDEKTLPIILVRDHSTRTTYSHAVPCKGTSSSKYPEKQVAHSIKQLGYSKIIFKSDNEPAILELRRAVCKILRHDHGMTVIEEESPVEDHQANGVVESANNQFGGMARTLNDHLIASYGWTPPTQHPIYAWLINHAGFL